MVSTLPQPPVMPRPARHLTAEEYFLLGGDLPTELMDGEVIELRLPGAIHGQLAVRLGGRLDTFVRQRKLGCVYVETGFVLRRRPDTVRGPDVSFVEASRLPESGSPSGFIEGAPTLAVEINSPNDLWTEVEAKARLYLEAGAQAVWIVDPTSRTVTVRAADNTTKIYGGSDTLSGGAVVPGFELPLTELFD